MKSRIATKLFCCLLLMALIPASFARMYKWVDAEGNTHYTQHPPVGIEAETIKPPPAIDSSRAQEQLQNRQQLLDSLKEERTKDNKAQEEKARDAEQQKAMCEKARARLASYQRPRVNLIGADGKPSRASEEQRQAEIAKSKEYVRELCE